MKYYLAPIVLPLIVACSPLPRQAEHLSSTETCCENTSNIDYLDLEAKEETDAEISETSPLFDFPGGRSYFAAFKIPSDLRFNRIHIASYPVGHILKSTQVLCPTFTFLDKDFNAVATKSIALRYVGPGRFTSAFYFNEFTMPSDSDYLIIHTRSADIGKTVLIPPSNPYALEYMPPFNMYEPDSNKGQNASSSYQKIPCGQVGSLKITVK